MASGCKKAGRNKNSPAMKRYNMESRDKAHKERHVKAEAKRQEKNKATPVHKSSGAARKIRRKDIRAFKADRREQRDSDYTALMNSITTPPHGTMLHPNGKKDNCGACGKKKADCVNGVCYECVRTTN